MIDANGKFVPPNKINWTSDMDHFLMKNFHYMTNVELAKALKLKLTTVRTRLYKLGCKRMEMEYWTAEQIAYLKANYKVMGDTELAELFNEKWEKAKGWSKKHIEKKRRYLKLKRNSEQKRLIKLRNTADGRFSINHWKRWHHLNSPIGKVVVWDHNGYSAPVIKTVNGYARLARFMYEYHYGTIPANGNIIHIDGNQLNCKKGNLKLVTDAELATFNGASSLLSDNYIAAMLTHKQPELREAVKEHPELIALKRAELQLNRKIRTYEQQDE